jgi:hypothetical protein
LVISSHALFIRGAHIFKYNQALASKTDWYEEVFTLLVEYYTTLVHTALAISCDDGALADCPWMEGAKTEFFFKKRQESPLLIFFIEMSLCTTQSNTRKVKHQLRPSNHASICWTLLGFALRITKANSLK